MEKSTKYKKSIGLLTGMLATLVTLSPFAIDTYLAAMPTMATFFGVHISTIELTITLYFLGFAIGNFLGGPLSGSFGRKPIALLGITLYAISSLLIAFSTSIEAVIALRLLQAFGGGFATVTANVIVRDWFTGKQVARLVTIISMIMMLAPLFAPVIGGILLHHFGWKSIFFFLSGFAVVLFIAFFILMPESRGKQHITYSITKQQLLGAYGEFLASRQSVILLFAVSFSMAGLYVFLTAASFIYIQYFDKPQNLFPVLFGANVILNVLFSLANTYLLKRYTAEGLLRTGLAVQGLAGLILLVTVWMPVPSFWAVFGSIVLFIGSLGLVFGNGTATILNINPKVSGSANATIGITRFVLSFVIGSTMALFHTNNLMPIGTAMFGCTLLANLFFMMAWKRRAGVMNSEVLSGKS